MIKSLLKYRVLKWGIGLLQNIPIYGLEGLSLYDLIEMYFIGIINGTLNIRASAIAFRLLTMLFPFLLFLLNLVPFIPVAHFQEELISLIIDFLPPKTSDFFNPILSDIIGKQRLNLLSGSFIVSMILMTNGIYAIFSCFHDSYHEVLSKNLFKKYMRAFFVAIFVALFLFLGVYLNLYYVYLITKYQEYLIGEQLFWLNSGRFFLVVLLIFMTTSVLFYFGSEKGRLPSLFSPGSILTTCLVIITTYFFAFYIDHFSNYNEIYGSIGALLIIAIYLWILSNLILLGFELNISIQKLKSKRHFL